jgi:uncharacterized membrane protein
MIDNIKSRHITSSLATVLRTGLLVASTIAAVGGALFLFHNGNTAVQYGSDMPFTGADPSLRTLTDLWQQLGEGNPQAIIQTGVALLILTPIARVVCSLFSFARKKDYLYTAISLAVLIIIVGNIFLK